MKTKVEESLQKNSIRRGSLRGIQSPGLLARSPIAGPVMVLAGSLTFGILAYLLMNDSLIQWDLTVARTFRSVQVNAPWTWMEDALFGHFLGREMVILIGAILAVYFLYRHSWRELAMVVMGIGGGSLIGYLLSLYFARPRPTDHLDVLLLAGPSFPSLPALAALLCYGLLAYLLIPRLPTLFWKWFAALLLVAAIVLVALSSLLFGTHYASDVIAGLALGLAWVGVVFSLTERVFRKAEGNDEDREQKILEIQGLRAPGWFQRRPIFALILILSASLVFIGLGYNLRAKGPLLQVDQWVYETLLVQAKEASPTVNDLMLFGFFLGKQAVQVIGAILSLYFLSQRYWREFAMIQVSSQGGGLLWNLIIDTFSRPRPPLQLGLATTTIPSFPSGHALGTMICYGFLAYLLVPKMPSRFWKWILGLAILAIVLFEGFTRVFHGNHYLTDVVAGYALGMTWLVLVCAVIEMISMRARETQER